MFGANNDLISKSGRLTSDIELARAIYYLQDIELLFVHQPQVSDDMIAKYRFKIDWRLLLKYDRLLRSPTMLNLYAIDIDWEHVLSTHQVPIEMIQPILFRIPAPLLIRYTDITDEMIVQHNWYFDWKLLAMNGRFSDSVQLLEHYKHDINFRAFFKAKYPIDLKWVIGAGIWYTKNHLDIYFENNELSINLLRVAIASICTALVPLGSTPRHNKFVWWNAIARHQRLSVAFLYDFGSYLNWELISRYQDVRILQTRFADTIDWDIITNRYVMTTTFLKKIKTKKGLAIHNHVDKKIIEKNAANQICRVYKRWQFNQKKRILGNRIPAEVLTLIMVYSQ